MISITFDTGALIALEKNQRRIWHVLMTAANDGLKPVVPTPVASEWWRGRTDKRESILAHVAVEPLSRAVALAAGEALAAVKGSTVVDAIVMASAAARGGVVYTSDIGDLERLRRHFPSVRLLAI